MVTAAVFVFFLGCFVGGVVTQRLMEQMHSEQLRECRNTLLSTWRAATNWHKAHKQRLRFHPEAERIVVLQ